MVSRLTSIVPAAWSFSRPAARARLGEAPEPSTGIVDSRSVAPGPQKGEPGIDGNKEVKGIERSATS